MTKLRLTQLAKRGLLAEKNEVIKKILDLIEGSNTNKTCDDEWLFMLGLQSVADSINCRNIIKRLLIERKMFQNLQEMKVEFWERQKEYDDWLEISPYKRK